MGQGVKARKTIKKRPTHKIESNSSHKTARKLAAKKGAYKQRAVSGNGRKKTITAVSKRKKAKAAKSQNIESVPQNIEFIMTQKADNILYYSQSSEDLSLIENDITDKFKTPITPKSFAPIPAVREPLSEYIMLRKQRDKQIIISQNKNNNPKIASDRKTSSAPNTLHIEKISNAVKPLPRSNAPIVANQGGLHALAFWLRTSRYKLIAMFKRNKEEKEAQKKRTKADILNEIAGLRAENAVLRKRLGKSVMPNGRTKFEKA